MSHKLISRNSDLQRMVNEGFEVEIRDTYLLVHSVPYVNSRGEIAFGTLVSELTQSSPDTLARPGTHQIYFIGEHPCSADGKQLNQIFNSSQSQQLGEGLVVQHYFSHKPAEGYANYYDKVTTYVRVISDQARVLDRNVDARTFKTIDSLDEDSVHMYDDTWSGRAGIRALSKRVAHQRVAIVGLGGTGAYLLDFLAKTHVREIHLFDGDRYFQHNAFRAPGASSRETLDRQLYKVSYFHEIYSAMHRGIVAHAEMITDVNVAALMGYDFVFVCVDKGSVRQLIADALESTSATFLDAGMGVNLTDDHQNLWGSCRLTTSSPGSRPEARARLPIVDREDDLYRSNIQIAELNCMNALMAIFKWKRLSGIYLSDRSDFNTTFSLSLNQISNEEKDQ